MACTCLDTAPIETALRAPPLLKASTARWMPPTTSATTAASSTSCSAESASLHGGVVVRSQVAAGAGSSEVRVAVKPDMDI